MNHPTANARGSSPDQRRLQWKVSPLLQLAAAAITAFGLWSTSALPGLKTGSSDASRAKGGWHLEFYVNRGEHTFSGDPLTPLHVGDRLRFAYSAPRASHLAIVGTDARGMISNYYPTGPTMAPISAGQHLLLDNSVELDATTGTEQIDAVFCDVPQSIAELHRRFAQAPDAPELPTNCQRLRLTIHKIDERL